MKTKSMLAAAAWNKNTKKRRTKLMTSEETYQREKSHKPFGSDSTLPLAPRS